MFLKQALKLNLPEKDRSFRSGLFFFSFRVFLSFLMFSGSFSGWGFSETPRAEEYFQDALDAREAGALEEAEGYFKKALEVEAGNENYHFELANLYALRYDSALKIRGREAQDEAKELLASSARELEQAVMIRQDFVPAHFNLGVVYKKQARYEDARNQFKKVLALNPDAYPAMLQVGATYEEQGFYDEAESVYEDVRDRGFMNPDVAYSLQGLAERRARAHEAERAGAAQSMAMLQSRVRDSYLESRGNPSYLNSGSSGSRAPMSSVGAMLLQQFMNSRAQKKQAQNSF